MNFRQNPHILFLLAGLVFFVCSFWEGSPLDIHLHDTYIVIAYEHIMWAFAAFFAFLFLIYRLLRKILASNVLSWIHVLATLLFFIISFDPFGIFRQADAAAMPKRYYEYSDFRQSLGIQEIILMVVMIGQLAFPVNILWGLAKLMRREK